jgi:hypothetical protein
VQQDDSRLRRLPGLAVEDLRPATSAVLKYMKLFLLTAPAHSRASTPGGRDASFGVLQRSWLTV